LIKKDDKNNISVELDIPQKGMKPAWLGLLTKKELLISQTLSQTTNPTDPRVIWLIKDLISSLPSKEVRIKIKKMWEEEFNKRKKEAQNNGGLTNEEEGRLNIEVALEIKGEITEFIDEFIGLTHKLAIGVA
jgi:hypothetical protein